MKVYLLQINPNDYDNAPFVQGIYATKEKAEAMVQTIAIENNEPALLLTKNFDAWENADCYHYPEYENTQYYIYEYTVE